MQLEMILPIIVVIGIVFLVLFVLAKVFESLLFATVTVVFICTAFTVFFGDGTEIVRSFASFMDNESGKKIEELYEFYKEKEIEGPHLNSDKISQYVTTAFEQAAEKGQELIFD